jgi:hypothetical protein
MEYFFALVFRWRAGKARGVSFADNPPALTVPISPRIHRFPNNPVLAAPAAAVLVKASQESFSRT